MQSRAEISARVEVGPNEALVVARDGSDAHLRLTVLLALQAPPSEHRERALSPQTSWPDRLKATMEVVERSKRPTVLVDPDALWVDRRVGEFSLGDHSTERRHFFKEVVELGTRQGWRFVRPNPRDEVTEALETLGVPITVAPTDGRFLELPLSLRPIACWMTEHRGIEASYLRRLLSAATDPYETLRWAFEEVVGPQASDLLHRLSLLREPHSLNGVAGPFNPTQQGPLALDPTALAEVRQTGALTCSGGAFWVPAPLRSLMARWFSLVDREPAMATRAAIAEALAKKSGVALLEAHRQAVLADDLELAWATARFFAADLRLIGQSLSRQAKAEKKPLKKKRLFGQAAEVYRRILTLNDEDAYAWHYLAYNLEQSRAPHMETRIEEAYRRSCELTDRTRINPLYHGRRLAFLAHQGQDVRAELGSLLVKTIGSFHERSMASWLVVNAKKGMSEAHIRDFESEHPWTIGLKEPYSPKSAFEV